MEVYLAKLQEELNLRSLREKSPGEDEGSGLGQALPFYESVLWIDGLTLTTVTVAAGRMEAFAGSLRSGIRKPVLYFLRRIRLFKEKRKSDRPRAKNQHQNQKEI